jgi:hypothetical protein
LYVELGKADWYVGVDFIPVKSWGTPTGPSCLQPDPPENAVLGSSFLFTLRGIWSQNTAVVHKISRSGSWNGFDIKAFTKSNRWVRKNAFGGFPMQVLEKSNIMET